MAHVTLNCIRKPIEHSLTAGLIGAIVVKFGHSISLFTHLGSLHAALFAATTALVARVAEGFMKNHQILDKNPEIRKIAAYAIGGLVATIGSVGIAAMGITHASVSLLAIVALVGVAFAVSGLAAQIQCFNPLTIS